MNVNKSQEIDREPFVLAFQIEQAFYVEDPIDREWLVMIMTQPRDFFDMAEDKYEDLHDYTRCHADPYARDP